MQQFIPFHSRPVSYHLISKNPRVSDIELASAFSNWLSEHIGGLFCSLVLFLYATPASISDLSVNLCARHKFALPPHVLSVTTVTKFVLDQSLPQNTFLAFFLFYQ